MTTLEIWLFIIIAILAGIAGFMYLRALEAEEEAETCEEIREAEARQYLAELQNDSSAMSFSDALKYLRMGRKVANRKWKLAGQHYIFLEYGSSFYALETPNPVLQIIADNNGKVKVLPHLMYKGSEATVSIWLPTNEDLLSDEWYVLPE